ncbi:hypothetical protein KKB11_05375 [Candidatus Micrarchaeota archaeon]|nr:hypothetical protein [Candidatus Micrarchaeota archaeon]
MFDVKDNWLSDKVCIWNIKEQVNKAVWDLGGPAKASKLMAVKNSRLKEWHLGRNPIPLSKLNELLLLIGENLKQELTKEINSKQIYLKCQYSNHTIQFPYNLTSELSYVIGLLLGDGSLAGNSLNKTGNWGISVYFDKINHLKIYKKIIEDIFKVKVKIYVQKGTCYCAYFASKAAHWFLRSFFGLHNGYKADKIEIPEIITETKNTDLIASCIRGLFDSDGTVIVKNKVISFSSTSEKIVNQVIFWLDEFGIVSKKSKWLKDKKYKMLFTAGIRGKNNISKFSEVIGFSHPDKKKRLFKIC